MEFCWRHGRGCPALAAVLLATSAQCCDSVSVSTGEGQWPALHTVSARDAGNLPRPAHATMVDNSSNPSLKTVLVASASTVSAGSSTRTSGKAVTADGPIEGEVARPPRGVWPFKPWLQSVQMQENYWFCIFGVTLLVSWMVEELCPEHESQVARPDEGLPAQSVCPKNLYTLNLMAAVEQAHLPDKPIPPQGVAFFTVFKSILQLGCLLFVVCAIDPGAEPVTIHPRDPWVQHSWSVNCMKWLTVILLAVFMVAEAADCRILTEAILLTNSSRLKLSKYTLMFIALLQYAIAMMIVWGGVVVVLSFQSVPDILYSSMAITMVAKVDKGFFHVLLQILDVQADFVIVHGLREDEREFTSRQIHAKAATHQREESIEGHAMVYGYATGGKRFAKSVSESMSSANGSVPNSAREVPTFQELVHEPISSVVYALLRFMLFLPIAVALGLMSWAFVTHVMPTKPLHQFIKLLFPAES